MITTIIPTYNRAQALERAIESILNQTFQEFTILVLDNASTDATSEMVNNFQDPRIQYLRQKKHVSLYQNFSTGLAKIQTEFFSFLSDDDYLLPWFYETALADHKKYPEIGFSANVTLLIDEKNRLKSHQPFLSLHEGYYGSEQKILQMIQKDFPNWTGILYHNKVLKKFPQFNKSVGTFFDLEFSLKCAATFPFYINPKPGTCFTQWPDSLGYKNAFNVHFFWPHFLKSLNGALINPNLSLELQYRMKEQIKKIIKSRLLKICIYTISYSNKTHVIECQRALNEIGNAKVAKLLFSLYMISKVIPFKKSTFKLLRKIWKKIKTVKQNKNYLNKQEIIHLLKNLNPLELHK